ncbi:MAG: HAD-IA family hydrolase, partial [Fusobacteria bacterium]|nr:HAD-IA family hydrolase [Fusobacteriota bacterium]
GRVLIDFQPLPFLEREFGESKAKCLYKVVFGNSKWSDFDLGKLSQKELIDKIVIENEVERFDVDKIFYLLPTLLRPFEDNCKYIEILCKKYNLYILSNFPKEPFLNVSQFSFFENFKGRVVSYEVGLKKPSSKIYQHIIEKYKLIPSETYFIDDSIENIEAAKKCGICGLHLESPSRLTDLLRNQNMIE